uniref:Uncharacterized protein n=1 Tax=Anguilla anguilla TaxID=7936 RepID=A0A0E9Q2E4_ANGAN
MNKVFELASTCRWFFLKNYLFFFLVQRSMFLFF